MHPPSGVGLRAVWAEDLEALDEQVAEAYVGYLQWELTRRHWRRGQRVGQRERELERCPNDGDGAPGNRDHDGGDRCHTQ